LGGAGVLAVDQVFLLAVAPKFSGVRARAQARIVAAIGPVLAPTLERYSIDTPLRIAHFTAQVTHECAGFRTTEEFASGAAYEGRADLGNVRPGDGVRYKGRGLLQLTGRANYARVGAALGLPLEAQPGRAAEPVLSLEIACVYWRDRQIDGPADRDDLVAATRRVNGGLYGLAERRRYLLRAKAALAAMGR
jgi:putative chitinase